MTNFAETILDSIVDENGHCEDRNISTKQFGVIVQQLREQDSDENFCSVFKNNNVTYKGFIGKYSVELFEHQFDYGRQYTLVNVNKWCDQLPDLSSSEYQFSVKDRVELQLTVVSEYRGYSDYGAYIIYTLADDNGNAFTWKTASTLGCDIESDTNNAVYRRVACSGSRVSIKGTVSAHTEYKGVKQTKLTRCKCFSVSDSWYGKAA